jgi:hypothetical protein
LYSLNTCHSQKQQKYNDKIAIMEIPPPPPPVPTPPPPTVRHSFTSSNSLEVSPDNTFFFQANPSAANKSLQYLQLFITCKALRSLDYLTVCDPLVVLFYRDKEGMFTEIGRTDEMHNSLNPEFSKSILLDRSEIEEWKDRLWFAVVDVDDDVADICNEDIIGFAPRKLLSLSSLEQVISDSSKKYYKTAIGVKNPIDKQYKQNGKIHVFVEETTKQRIDYRFRMKVRAINLANINWFGRVNAYIVVRRLLENSNNINDPEDNGMCHKIYQSEAILNSIDPFWEDIIVPVSHWCNGNLEAELVFEVYDYRSKLFSIFSDKLIGAFKASTRDLMKAEKTSFSLKRVKRRDLLRGIYVSRFIV